MISVKLCYDETPKHPSGRIGGRSLFVARLHGLAISIGYALGNAYQFRSDGDL
jgi:hypothetical protein